MEEEFKVSKAKKLRKFQKRKKWIGEKVELSKRMKRTKTIKEVLLDNIFNKTYKDVEDI